ncbi:ABC transporter substrate-binding protein [Paenibacillus sp. P26]|nr:ABC transporter substrate-binding protein [Paenibacillus sp. P26]
MKRLEVLGLLLLFLLATGRGAWSDAADPAKLPEPMPNAQEALGGAGPDIAAAAPHERSIVLGFSQVGSESGWRVANTVSIQNAAKQAGIDLKFSDAQRRQDHQISAIRSFIAQKVDVIAFSPVVESGWDEVLKEAQQAGIPVIITDRSVDVKDTSLYVTLIGSNFLEEGQKAAKYIIDKMRNVSGPIHIVELQGTMNSAPAIDRKKGFEEVIKENPNMKPLAADSGDFTRENGKLVMERYLRQYGRDIQVLFAHNDDMALGAIEAIEEYGLRPGKDIVIVSVDAGRAAFEAMLQGKLNCTVECNPLLGPQLMQAAKELVAGRNLPKRIVTRESVFTQGVAAREIENRKY